MTEQLDGGWYTDTVTPGIWHFVPTGLPVALCAAPIGRYAWISDVWSTRCSECAEAYARIEGEMAEKAAATRPLKLGGESAS